jgi:hypothetical protein
MKEPTADPYGPAVQKSKLRAKSDSYFIALTHAPSHDVQLAAVFQCNVPFRIAFFERAASVKA